MHNREQEDPRGRLGKGVRSNIPFTNFDITGSVGAMPRTNIRSYFNWAVSGCVLGLLLGIWISFNEYMDRKSYIESMDNVYGNAFKAAARLESSENKGMFDRSSALLDVNQRGCDALSPRAQLLCNIARSQIQLKQSGSAVTMLGRIESEQGRIVAANAILADMRSAISSHDDDNETTMLKLSSIKKSLSGIFNNPINRANLLLEMSNLEREIFEDEAALATLDAAKNESLKVADSPRDSSLTKSGLTAFVTEVPLGGRFFWVPVCGFIGFIGAGVLKPILAGLGKVLIGEPLSRMMANPELRHVYGLRPIEKVSEEAKTEPEPTEVKPQQN
jgi:hypothetical protein